MSHMREDFHTHYLRMREVGNFRMREGEDLRTHVCPVKEVLKVWDSNNPLNQQVVALICFLESYMVAILVVSREGIQEHRMAQLFFPSVARTCSTILLSISRSHEILPDTLRAILSRTCSLLLVLQCTLQ